MEIKLSEELSFITKQLDEVMADDFGNMTFESKELEKEYNNIRYVQLNLFKDMINISYGQGRSPLVCEEFTDSFCVFLRQLKFMIISTVKVPSWEDVRNSMQKTNLWVEVMFKCVEELDDLPFYKNYEQFKE